MRYIDLFAGVGGFHYGIESSVRRNAKTLSQDEIYESSPNRSYGKGRGSYTPTCVYSNEWDKYANSVYRRHYGECDDRDITTVTTNEIPDHDLLCAGFPCQAFSVAGKRLGFEDTRGTLFFEIARIARDKRPRYLLLENVKGLLSHDKGKTFQTILGVLSDLGYSVEWQVLNSKHFGVPQNRERIIIVGHLGGRSGRQVFPIIGTSGKTIKQIGNIHEYRGKIGNPETGRIYSKDGISPTLNTMQGGGKHPKITQNIKIRRLTPIECERLQGFPDNWTQYGHDGKEMSDTQRYKMMGNAVTTNVIQAVFSKLISI